MKRLFLYLVLLACVACDKTLGPPADVLPEVKMIEVLADLQVAEGKVKSLRISSDSARHIYNIYELKVFDKHNVEQQQYLRSYAYYLENQRSMTRIHDAILDTLQKRQQKLESMPDPEPPQLIEDSLAEISETGRDIPGLNTVIKDSLQSDSLAERRELPTNFKKRRNNSLLKKEIE